MQIKTKIVSCLTADSKPVKQEVNGIVILPPLVFPVANWQLIKSIFLAGFAGQRDINKDNSAWLDGARLPHISFIGHSID